eukprot:TRINITY_DN1927_c0_g1_i1.p1 TRINITY_DN1927_c0_g1~~TRINITY_DN1927_c0_g1_i1.p1  ORF type:complete len:787 (-),score=19.37 TRINITY_DN1927_c0_g1_i1:97-2457(-)
MEEDKLAPEGQPVLPTSSVRKDIERQSILDPESTRQEIQKSQTVDELISAATIAQEKCKNIVFKAESVLSFDGYTLISPCPLQPDRFDKKNIKILFTKDCKNLCKSVVTSLEKRYTFKIMGLIGTGKSHALLSAALYLRKHREKYRVLCFNEPSILKSTDYIFSSLVYAFYNDKFTSLNGGFVLNGGNLWEEWKKVCSEDGMNGIIRLLKALEAYCKENKLIFVLIVDQMNILFRSTMEAALKNYMNLSETILYQITCGSLNNDSFGQVPAAELPYFSKWGKEETWLYAQTLRSIPVADHELELIEQTTGGIPLEIAEFLKMCSDNVINSTKIERYLEKRALEYSAKHSEYRGQRNPDDIARLNKIYTLISLGMPITETVPIFDEQLVIKVKNATDQIFLQPICPAAEKGLEIYYKTIADIQSSLMKKVAAYKAVAGIHMDKYLVLSLKRIQNTSAQSERIYFFDSMKKRKYCTLKISADKTFFSGTSEYYQECFKIFPKNTLMVPFDRKFNHIDCAVIDKYERRLFVFQVALNIQNNKRSDIEFLSGDFLKEFLKFIGADTWTVTYFWVSCETNDNDEGYQKKDAEFTKKVKSNFSGKSVHFEHYVIYVDRKNNTKIFTQLQNFGFSCVLGVQMLLYAWNKYSQIHNFLLIEMCKLHVPQILPIELPILKNLRSLQICIIIWFTFHQGLVIDSLKYRRHVIKLRFLETLSCNSCRMIKVLSNQQPKVSLVIRTDSDRIVALSVLVNCQVAEQNNQCVQAYFIYFQKKPEAAIFIVYFSSQNWLLY